MRLARVLPLVIVAMLAADARPAADFSKWWSDFQGAVAKRDAKAVAQMAHFPLSWELGPIREIKTEADLLKSFDTYFTAEIRKAVAAGKPEKLPDGTYTITWKARGNEYSLYFRNQPSGFVLDALSEGPA